MNVSSCVAIEAKVVERVRVSLERTIVRSRRDRPAKVVGKRRPAESHPRQFDIVQEMVNRTWKGLPFPKGVRRFKTEEEFDEWRTRLLIRNSPARRTSVT